MATDVNRPDFEYNETNGGFVLKFNPGVYEEVRKLLDIKLETEYKPSKQILLDAKGFHHTITYRIKNITGPNYTVNLYLTTSKMMVNGPDAPEFIVLLKEIVESVNKTTATEINNIITRHVSQMTTRTTRRSARTSKPTEKAKQLQDKKNLELLDAALEHQSQLKRLSSYKIRKIPKKREVSCSRWTSHVTSTVTLRLEPGCHCDNVVCTGNVY